MPIKVTRDGLKADAGPIRISKALKDAFSLEGADVHRLLCQAWRDVYRGELGALLVDETADEVRIWLRDASPHEFAELLRVAYQDGKRSK